MTDPDTYDFVLLQGSKLAMTFTYRDDDAVAIPLTDYTARSHLRENYGDADPVLNMTPYLTIDEPAGMVTLAVPATVTEDITALRGVWDIELVPPTGDDDAFRLVGGRWKLSKEATR